MTTQNAMESEKDPDIRHGPPAPVGKPANAVYGDQRQGVDGTCSPAQLHVCFHCAGELVYPLDWSEEGPRHWRIVLRCPECESRREGVFDQSSVERLDDELDRGSSALLGDLRRMTHANMSEEIEFFVRALDAELIMPSDF
ncbi:MAG TPA: hypothetical protein VIH92_09475 [Solirubrobacteraceae bacterium]